MFSQQLNHRLGPEDNSFLIYDTEASPMNIGAVSVFAGDIARDEFIEYVRSKMHLVPRYEQIVVPTPFGIGRPTWEFDPNFDVNRHIHEVLLEPPGTLDQLFTTAARIHEGRLARDRPLWEIHLVRGLEGGNTGMVAKVHHCMVDGVGGMSLLMIVLDPSPEYHVEVPQDYTPPRVPDGFTRISDAFFDMLSEGLDAVTNVEERILDIGTPAGADWLRMMGASMRTALPYFLFPAKKAPFNKPFSGGRSMTGLAATLDEVNGIRQVTGGTINDVAVSVVGGAVSSYLEKHGEDVSRRIIRIFTPVNIRRKTEEGTLGNRISMLLVEVPADVKDPLMRLDVVREQTARLKRERVSDGVEVLSSAVFTLPTNVSKALVDMGALPLDRMGNMVCTNVPGPRFPLYTMGHEMLSMYPITPIGWEMGIGCAITSYNGTLYVGLNADTGAAPDADLLRDCLIQSYVELRSAAGMDPGSASTSPVTGGRAVPR
jgi:WS/DGAT/MGAT family acyltransferase